ncbi:MAG TPA: hypothetical protein DCL86_10830 [Bacteroidales bacterium]|nr:hypothetical protein [Bacteroidales bacterium]
MNKDNRTSAKPKALQAGALTINQHGFMAYVRTLQFMKTRLKGIDDGEVVHIDQKEIEQRFFVWPKNPRKQALEELIAADELEISEQMNPISGRIMLMYRAINPDKWPLDLRLLKPKKVNYGPQTKLMQGHLMRVSLPPGAPSTPYFDFFLQNRNFGLDYFFTVDAFASRVHTPITNFHRTHRTNLLIDGQTTIGLDVTTMQPLLLGMILHQRIGANDFSNWIESGEDIYIKLQQAAGLETRDQGKKRFFEIIFARANNSLAEMFGAADWITWINAYKRNHEPGNPHSKAKPYSNLSWLLQSTEVQTMRKVWQSLNESGIPFLSVHDEIICKQQNRHQAESLFRRVLDDEFTFYKLNVKEATHATETPLQCNIPQHPETMPQATGEAKPERIAHPIKEQPDDWSKDIIELETYYKSIELPTQPIKLNQCTTIMDINLFIDGHLSTIKANNGKPHFLPYLDRLKEVKQILTDTLLTTG